MRQEMGVFVSPITRDLDATRAELHETQQELAALRQEREFAAALLDQALSSLQRQA